MQKQILYCNLNTWDMGSDNLCDICRACRLAKTGIMHAALRLPTVGAHLPAVTCMHISCKIRAFCLLHLYAQCMLTIGEAH